ncbi:MAG: diguanylate cyclase [Gemmatimonadetes bacterium]|nr:diguanylate cyclase [Gemmatimonadota bacterium]
MPEPARSTTEERYSLVLDLGRALSGVLRPEQLYPVLYERVARALDVVGFMVARYHPEIDTAIAVYYAEDGATVDFSLAFRGSESVALREARPSADPNDYALRQLRGARPELGGAPSGLVAPMVRGGRVLGFVAVLSRRADAYAPGDLDLLALVAGIAAVSLENALHVQEMEKRRLEAERLDAIGRTITASLKLADVLERVTMAALELVGGDAAAVWLDREGRAEVAFTVGDAIFPVGERIPVDCRLLEELRRERTVFRSVDDYRLLPAPLRDRLREGSTIAALLTSEENVVGALLVRHCGPLVFGDAEVELLERIAARAAIAVTNARLHEQILQLSLTDPLTGLPNRRHMEMHLEKEFAAARRGRRLAVAIFDLDNFKTYNDTFGHQAGDEALRAFGSILAAETRAMNLAARYGGDEFIAILADTDSDGARTHIERVLALVRKDPLLGPAGLGASVGLAFYVPEMESARELIAAADRVLYRRKAARAGPIEV